MRVAIIGAGISGLSCAFELKKYGIIPTIFEKKSHLGQDMNFPITSLRLFNNSIRNPVKYLKQKYGLVIKPAHAIKEQVLIGPSKKAIIKGKMGYIFIRGEEENSLENQIISQLDIPINYDQFIDVDEIKNSFDIIVSATGDDSIAKKMDIWNTTLNCYTRIATVLGHFDTEKLKMWVNTKYSKNTFCFMAANTSKQAYIVMNVNGISYRELEHYWKEFLEIEGLDFRILEMWDYEQNIGFAKPIRLGNILFTGNTAGTIDSFLGFGSFEAIESGILAAKAITKGLDYSKIMQPLIEKKQMLHHYREALNSFTNEDYDKLLTFINLPVIKQFMYNNPLLRVRHGVFIAKYYNMLKGKGM